MDTNPEGWTATEYKKFRVDESDSESDSDSDSDSDETSQKKTTMKGYKSKEYKKILVIEDLLPE